jgi:Pyrimidine dimer DNA glycosylase
VQTFLPFADFVQTAVVLDRQRLGSQRVEAMQLFNALTVPGHGYRHHPAAKMWHGCEEAIVRYTLTMCAEWTRRGYGDTVADKISAHALERLGIAKVRTQAQLARARQLPAWLGDADFHQAHQSNLMRKNPDHYREFFGDVPANLEYVWPLPGE